MIRLTLRGDPAQSRDYTQALIRVGRGSGCDWVVQGDQAESVSQFHAQISLRDGSWLLQDTGSTNGTLVNGQRIQRRVLQPGDVIRLGAGGPELLVEIDFDAIPRGAPAVMSTAPRPALPDDPSSDLPPGDPVPAGRPSTALAVERAVLDIEAARSESGGRRRSTRSLLREALHEVSATVQARTRRRWVRVVLGVAGVGLLGLMTLGVIVVRQQRQLAALLARKAAIDRQIEQVQEAMQNEDDPGRLAQQEQLLDALTGNAEATLVAVGQRDKARAAQLAQGSDELDREIRRILSQFDATTYAVPPIFRERLQYHIDQLVHSGTLGQVYRRKQKYWPIIRKEFGALELPEDMAYIAWAESEFDPEALSGAGARGMWQMTVATAERYGLMVNDSVDQRLDVRLQTHAAARYLADLLSEFGEDAFMLALASYNRGEAGVRRALHDVAADPGGFRRDKRNFWHLYRLKKLPPETREYVPRVLAAAVIGSNPERYGLAPASSSPQASH